MAFLEQQFTPVLGGTTVTSPQLSIVIIWRCYKWRVNSKPPTIAWSEFLVTLLVSQFFGWTLASIPWMLFIGGNDHERLLIAASCAGLIATGMSMAVMPIVAIQFSGPIVVSSFVTLLTARDPYYNYVSILLIFYAAFLLVTVKSLSRLVTNWVAAQGALERQQQLTRASCFWVYAYPAFLRYAAHSAGGYWARIWRQASEMAS